MVPRNGGQSFDSLTESQSATEAAGVDHPMPAASLFVLTDIYAEIRAQFYSKVWQKCFEAGQIGDMFG
jgi:hypothetical protein